MIELWALLAIAGAFLQNVRSLLQRRLTATLSVQGASYVRFLYALPFAWGYYLVLPGELAGGLNQSFFGYCLAGAVAQILGTYGLVAAVSRGNFAVGTAYSKTESAQAALFGLLLVGDPLTLPLLVAIAVSFVGVVLLAGQSAGPSESAGWLDGRVLPLGLLAGAGFALSAVCFRGAALALGADGAAGSLVPAALTLACVLVMQALLQGVYLLATDAAQLRAVVCSWRPGLWIGAAGMLASVCWFTAMAMHPAAAVRAVGQVEMLFAALTSFFLFRERIGWRALLGMGLIVSGILLLVRT